MVDCRPRATYGIGRPAPPWSKGSGFGLISKGRSDIILKPGPTRGSFTVYPYQVGIIIADGILEYVFEEEKRTLPKGEVRTYVVSTAPFRLLFQLKLPWEPSEPEDIVLDPPLTTSDAQHVTGRIDLTASVITQGSVFTSVMPEGAHRLLQLLGLDGDVITKSDVVDVIKGELWPKLLALDLHSYTADELRNNQGTVRDFSNSLRKELASAIDRFGLQLDDFYINWAPQAQELAPIKHPVPDSRPEDPKTQMGDRTSAPAKSTPKQMRSQDSQSRRGSRSSPARRQPVSKRKTIKTVMQRIDESGLFNNGVRQESTHYKVSCQVKGRRGATIFVTHDESEFLIRKRALKDDKFPNSDRLREFALSHAHGTECGKEHRTTDFAISVEHLEEVIELIRSGRQEISKSRGGSRSSRTRRPPASKRATRKTIVDTSIKQQLEDSGLFDDGNLQKNGSVSYQVKGAYAATIYVTKNEREIHIRNGALQKNRFQNPKLYDFVRSRAHGTAHGKGNSAYAFRLGPEHLAKVIELIRIGLQQRR